MTKTNNDMINVTNPMLSSRWNRYFLNTVFLISLLHLSLAAGPTPVVEKGFPFSDGHYVNIWAPQPQGRSTRSDQIWFMTKQPGTNITMTASLKGGCKSCSLTGKSLSYYGIEQPDKWYKLKVFYTAKYGACTVNIEGNYYYPRRQNKEVSPSTIRIDSTSDLYWTKLNPDDEPFFQQSNVECPSAPSGSGIQLKLTTSGGFELDLMTLVSIGANALLLLLLMVTVCYYKQKVKAEVNLRKSKEDSLKVTYRQSMDPASFITYQKQSQRQTEEYDTYQNNHHDEHFQDDNQTDGSSFNTADSHQYQGQENKNYQE